MSELPNDTPKCECDEWQNGIKQVNDAIIFCNFQGGGPKFNAEPFRFCPWCGGLKLDELDNDAAKA